jgi:cytochrome P450
MLRDPREYKDPELFNPERFLGDKPERDPHKMAFGYGRRYDGKPIYILP